MGGGTTFIAAWNRPRFFGIGTQLMYPRNAASPERISIGAVVQISDGAVQTSGVSVKVLPQGGTASASGGTVAYEEGIVHYTPTQAETNYASFVLIAYKTGCIPATTTVVTSASATTGYAGLDWAKVSAPTTTLNLSGTTISTAQKVDLETIKTQAVTAAAGVTFPTSVASPTNITAATGVTLAATTGLGNQTANITGNLSGSVGSVTGNVGGSVASVAANGITATSIAADAINAAAVKADAVTKIQSGLATPTNITAGTITTVTSLTNPVTLADGAHGGSSASLVLGAGATISKADGHALTLTGGTNGHGLLASGAGTGSGIAASGGSTSGSGIYAVGDADGMGIYAVGGDSALGLTAGLFLKSNASSNPVGLYIEDGAIITDDAGTALQVSSTGGDGDGVTITGNGTGGDLVADITGNVSGSVGSVTGAVGSVGTGGITSGSFASGAITATAIAADAIGASELAADAVTEIANAIAALTVDTGITLQEAMKLVLAVAAGKVSGASGTTVTIRDTSDTYDRIVATVDASGNRTALTYVTT